MNCTWKLVSFIFISISTLEFLLFIYHRPGIIDKNWAYFELLHKYVKNR